jgi:methionine-rich copper-binding protein CopC
MNALKSTALAVFVVLATSASVWAHAKMTESVPKDGATVPAGLSSVDLRFSKPMRLTLVRIHNAETDADVPVNSELPKTFVEEATLSIEPLAAGAYEVHWTAVSQDGHVMKGGFGFTVRKPPAP